MRGFLTNQPKNFYKPLPLLGEVVRVLRLLFEDELRDFVAFERLRLLDVLLFETRDFVALLDVALLPLYPVLLRCLVTVRLDVWRPLLTVPLDELLRDF